MQSQAVILLRRLFWPTAVAFSIIGILWGVALVLKMPGAYDGRRYAWPVEPNEYSQVFGMVVLLGFAAMHIVCVYQCVAQFLSLHTCSVEGTRTTKKYP